MERDLERHVEALRDSLPSVCTSCGESCANRAATWAHTLSTGHEQFEIVHAHNSRHCSHCRGLEGRCACQRCPRPPGARCIVTGTSERPSAASRIQARATPSQNTDSPSSDGLNSLLAELSSQDEDLQLALALSASLQDAPPGLTRTTSGPRVVNDQRQATARRAVPPPPAPRLSRGRSAETDEDLQLALVLSMSEHSAGTAASQPPVAARLPAARPSVPAARPPVPAARPPVPAAQPPEMEALRAQIEQMSAELRQLRIQGQLAQQQQQQQEQQQETRTCELCYDGIVSSAVSGMFCTERHFVCAGCAPMMVQSFLDRVAESDNLLEAHRARDGRIPCFRHTPGFNPQCHALYAERSLAAILPDEIFDQYRQSQNAFINERFQQEIAQEIARIQAQRREQGLETQRREQGLEAQRREEQLTADFLRRRYRHARMCPRCRFGPVINENCDDLEVHDGEHVRGSWARISNACGQCGFFTPDWNEWHPWDGVLRAGGTGSGGGKGKGGGGGACFTCGEMGHRASECPSGSGFGGGRKGGGKKGVGKKGGFNSGGQPPCYHWQAGNCSFGFSCRFAHD